VPLDFGRREARSVGSEAAGDGFGDLRLRLDEDGVRLAHQADGPAGETGDLDRSPADGPGPDAERPAVLGRQGQVHRVGMIGVGERPDLEGDLDAGPCGFIQGAVEAVVGDGPAEQGGGEGEVGPLPVAAGGVGTGRVERARRPDGRRAEQGAGQGTDAIRSGGVGTGWSSHHRAEDVVEDAFGDRHENVQYSVGNAQGPLRPAGPAPRPVARPCVAPSGPAEYSPPPVGDKALVHRLDTPARVGQRPINGPQWQGECLHPRGTLPYSSRLATEEIANRFDSPPFLVYSMVEVSVA